MSFAAHGNWCGPGWSARQWKDAKDLTEEDKKVEAVDALDQACKNHDIRIAEGDPEANEKFAEEAGALGIKGAAFAALVKWLGPSSQSILQNREQMIPTRIRTNKKRKVPYEVKRKANLRTSEAEANIKEALQQQQDDADIEAAEDVEITEAILDAQGDVPAMVSSNFVTPDRPVPTEPNLSRGEGQPIRGPRNPESLPNLPDLDNNDMADQDEEMAPMAARSAAVQGGTTTRAGNRETLVRYNARAEMGIFTETRTAYLPLTVYFSINRTKIGQSIPLHFRVDWPVNIFSRNTLVAQQLKILYNESNVRAQGLSNDMAKQGLRGATVTGTTAAANNFHTLGVGARDPAYNQAQLIPFPTTVVGNVVAVQGTALVAGTSSSGTISDGAAVPAYRRWYAKMYQYAHCMETDWRVTYFSGDMNEEFQNIRVYEGLDCQSDGNTDTIPIDRELGTVDHWPYLKKHDVICRTESKACQQYVISGTWNPNKQHPMKMVANEEDVKTWTKLNATDFADRTTNYREDVTLLHYSHPDSFNNAAFVNVRVDLRYKIQFKDLSNSLRWPSNVSTLQLTNLDCIQIPYPTQTTSIAGNPERVWADGVVPR